ncbi:putative Zn(2)-C6 fungal-type domain-containing protein [Seiridium unicorne]|uniref:Zn(2)-C6 fungal-type domain-containing protein n=1 Tax=Seiridium unicorne TaxID=138068 RepID=A0ABR2V6K0_9PEZI
MQAYHRPGEQTYARFGHRRGASDQARFAGDLTWATTETECRFGTRAYPSPPMSGSPPLPPKPVQEAGDRGHSSYQATSHDAYRPALTVQGGDFRAAHLPPVSGQARPPPPLTATSGVRPYPLETADRTGYPTSRPDEGLGRPMTLPALPSSQQPHYPLPPVPGSMPTTSPYSLPPRPPTSEGAPYTSPKSQRKTKGHVASACVPCKRAHLRCDAQRPCSRCLSNGKEDACVDVQHKKRGRPRLRDDRETRFDSSRFQHPADPMRRPVSLYAPVSAPAVAFDDPLRRSQSYRVLKSQPSEPTPPRYLERGSASDANVFPPPLMIPSRPLEPIAFLTVDLEIARVSNTFVDAIGAGVAQAILGRKLEEITAPQERDRVAGLQRALQEEQGRKEPNYLPPIFGRQELERIVHSLPLDSEFISRLSLDRHDSFTFLTAQRQGRQFPIRVGLAKEDSVYFVVLLLNIQPQIYAHPPPSPHSREIPYSYHTQPFAPQLTPVSASFETNRPRLGDPREQREGSLVPRQPVSAGQVPTGPSPGVSPNVPSYAASSGRFEHPAGPSYQIPRSELPATRAPVQPGYQLPPIRSQGHPSHPSPASDPRAGRVDIGGLIDRPDVGRRGP